MSDHRNRSIGGQASDEEEAVALLLVSAPGSTAGSGGPSSPAKAPATGSAPCSPSPRRILGQGQRQASGGGGGGAGSSSGKTGSKVLLALLVAASMLALYYAAASPRTLLRASDAGAVAAKANHTNNNVTTAATATSGSNVSASNAEAKQQHQQQDNKKDEGDVHGGEEPQQQQSTYDTSTAGSSSSSSITPAEPLYECPATVARDAANANDADNTQAQWYDEKSRSVHRDANLSSDYFAYFRQAPEYDNWGHTYAEVKRGMYGWKSKRFGPLKSNATIYESASGVGLNLYMTLEILEEVHGIHNLRVFGNEYVPESVEIAIALASHPKFPGTLGRFCQGDSSSIGFVPSDAFDLAFSGYISPLTDPLKFNLSNDDSFDRYQQLCESKEDEVQRQNRLAQRRQEDWYASWVGELVRIAKPGAPVIVEQVSYPLCEAYFDWGGVPQGFWKRAISKYSWDVDPLSLEMEPDTIFRRRYHVFMRKKKDRSFSVLV